MPRHSLKAPGAVVYTSSFLKKIDRIYRELTVSVEECDKVLIDSNREHLHGKVAYLKKRIKDASLLLRDGLDHK